ncbi:uncharacterized protein LOC107016762 [Solanum pennellii]|uniref:Uncharacterized protein LOC107016762 n=1 Tax=Solanum pennellii TaxID=28526 RepID=A0ABM1GL10_SOLPN|nr:uncharacterized protein LOC107016762 [Solanum pennellii]
MVNLTKLEFTALQNSGRNYLSWVLDAEIHLDAMGLGDTIKEENKASNKSCVRAMIFLRHHLDEILKIKYLTVKDPLVLWKNLKERFDHLKMAIHPKARYDWMHLRLQDFKYIHKYNSAMFRITSQLKLCGETVIEVDMMEKTFFTFHASNVLFQQQYREKGFKKYSELISHLLVAEQNNDLLLKNHENRPTGSELLPEVNEAYAHHPRHEKGRGPHHGRGRRRDRGRDYGQERHYARDCRTPKHFVELYQESLKNKEKNPEANFISGNQVDITHMGVANFFAHPEGKIDHLIGDCSVNMEE